MIFYVRAALFTNSLELLLDPVLRQEHVKEGLLYVTARISRFMLLSQFLSQETWEDYEDFRNLQETTRRTLLDLYRKTLEFEMNCVCASASAWNMAAKNVVDWHGWKGMNTAIREIDDLICRDIDKHGTKSAKERLLRSADDMSGVLAAEVGRGESSASANSLVNGIDNQK